ncbi:PREDICTED: amyotrophic lateral sclerosis 2 chromosomal region candidate gene 11 protein [Colobus angolensis palliatus]|uniref:Cation channel sperm-associated targeting subunit tau C2 domain-containing protein n=1 Tax=Colobus angolensis palliatus TaxID=336983 RepID=A0A2K5HSH4_COLAP|nr:PREDICTED: amyotrophic lateral sclerosis 2 chromosomal region candidate gene 11 protein [Colobus angolensis palliatus]
MEPPQETNRPFSTLDNCSGRVQALSPTPLLQKNPYSSPDIMHIKGSEASSVPYTLDQGMMALPKDKKKEGTGHRLLNMLEKTLKGSDSEELEITQETPNLVPFGDVVGCLGIHVKNCRHFTPNISLQHYANLFIRISINKAVKCTKMCSLLSKNSERNTVIKFDEVKYFSVQKGCFIEEVQVLHRNIFVCRLEVEFMFSYGNFGYGFSHQLKPLQKITEPSMFMNPAPPPERTDPVTKVITPQTVEYPAFLSPDLNVTVGTPAVQSSDQTSVVRLEKLQQQPRERLEKMKKEYRNLNTWIDKANYLESILMPKLEHKDTEETNVDEASENLKSDQSEEELENVAGVDIPLVNEEAETTPNELLDNDSEKGLTVPTLNQLDQDNSTADASKSDESTPSPAEVHSLCTISNQEIIKAGRVPPLGEHQSESMPDRKMKNVFSPSEVKLKDNYPSILKADSSLSEVAFSPKEYNSPSFRPEYIEFKPKFQFQKVNKNGFDPFLRNINKMSVRKRKDQDTYKRRNILDAEVIEHEDQDPPYPAQSKTAGPANKTWAHDPNIFTTKTSETENKLAPDPTINTIKGLDTKNNLKENLPNVSLPSFKGESSRAENVHANTCHLSKSLNFTPQIEYLKQSIILKSILSKNLQDLSDKLFSKPEVSMNSEAREKSSSLLISIHDKSSSSMEDNVLEKKQDLDNWLSEKDILNSKTTLSQIIKNIPVDLFSEGSQIIENIPADSLSEGDQVIKNIPEYSLSERGQIIKNIPADSFSEGGPGQFPEAEEHVSKTYFETDERDFPIKKKSSIKKKHLISEVPNSKPGSSGTVHDHIVRQIFTAPMFSELEIEVKEPSETPMNLETQLPTPWKRSLSSHILLHEDNADKIELPQPRSAISQIIQAFPIDTLLESGIIKVIELDKERCKSSLLGTGITPPKGKLKDSQEYYSEIRSETEPLSEQNIPIIPKDTTSVSRVEFIQEDQNMFPQDSSYYSIANKEQDLPRNGQRLGKDENDLSSTLESLANSLMDKLNESDEIMLKSFLKNIFNVFFKYNQSERRGQPERESERLIQPSFSDTEHLKEIQENFDKVDKLDRKHILSPKLRVFLEELSESEVKNLKSELSKQIQHYLVERLSESGHITKEDLPKIYRNLYLMNEKVEQKGPNSFQGKYSETVKEIMSFVKNFNHHFIDKHLEIKLRSFLNEILQNYFLKNISESSLFNETESETIYPNMSSLRTKSVSLSFHELQDISKGSFGRRFEINMKYPLSKSLQNYLIALSENELLHLKADLSKHLQGLFIEKLSKSGLMTKRQLEEINQHINLLNSSSIPLKYIKTHLPFRDDHHFVEKHSEKQNKYSRIVQQTTLQTVSEDKLRETELIREKEKKYFPLQNLKENSSLIREQKSYYTKEEAKTPSLIKVQPSSNKNIQASPLNNSSETLTDTLLKKLRKEHVFMQLPQAKNSVHKTEIQDPYSWGGKLKITQSKAWCDRTQKMKSLDRKEHVNIYKWTVQEKPEAVLTSYPRIPNARMPREDEYVNRLTFPSWQTSTLTRFNTETEEKSKLEDQYCQRLKGNHNNNKKHLVTFAQYKKEIQTFYIKPDEICSEKCAKFPEIQSFQYKDVENEKNSKPSVFPELFKREDLKPKVRKERDRVAKPKKSFNKIVRILPTTLPTTRIHLKKSVPRTLLHWTARTTIHDCSDKFEDLHDMTSFIHFKKVKSRSRLLGKSSDDIHNHARHSARPYTALEVNKQRESCSGKFTSRRMVSSGLVHINDKTSYCEMQKMRPKKIKRGY